jgi:hypothetical protein
MQQHPHYSHSQVKQRAERAAAPQRQHRQSTDCRLHRLTAQRAVWSPTAAAAGQADPRPRACHACSCILPQPGPALQTLIHPPSAWLYAAASSTSLLQHTCARSLTARALISSPPPSPRTSQRLAPPPPSPDRLLPPNRSSRPPGLNCQRRRVPTAHSNHCLAGCRPRTSPTRS